MSSLLAVGVREITSIVILRGKRVPQEKLPCGITNKCNKK